MQTFPLTDFLARSTDQQFGDTTLSKVLAELPHIGPQGPYIAGGALRRTVLQQEPDSDFDFFFRDADQLKSFENSIQRRAEKVRETEHHVHYRGNFGGGIPRDIQLIRFKFYQNAFEVADSFDFTICQLVFDGNQLTCGDFTLWDLARKRLAVHKLTYPLSSMRRVLKYGRQGFTACNGCLSTILRATTEHPELRTDIAYVD